MTGKTSREGAPQGASDPLRSALLILGRMDDGPMHDLAAGIKTLDTFAHCANNAPQAAVSPQHIAAASYWIAERLGASIKQAREMLDQAVSAGQPDVEKQHAEMHRLADFREIDELEARVASLRARLGAKS